MLFLVCFYEIYKEEFSVCSLQICGLQKADRMGVLSTERMPLGVTVDGKTTRKIIPVDWISHENISCRLVVENL